MFHESPARGEAPSAQAQGIYNLHRVEMARQLRLHGSPDSVKRASVINFLGSAAGRPSEISELSPENLSWDQRFKCACVQWAQFKTFKCKLVMFPAGANQFLCVINSFACAFAAGCFGMQAYDRDGMNYFYPDLAEASQPSTTISSWLKALSPTSSNVTYQNHRVASLPEDPTAAGIRVGSINEMAAGAVSAENTLAVSGHDAEKLSTLWHDMTLTLAALIPGANVLAGWLAPVYYKLGEGPTPASFDVLVSGGVDMDCLDRLTDLMLRLMPGLAPPMMLRGGSLRPLALAMAATLVMFYSESVNAGEVLTVTQRMRESMVEAGLQRADQGEVHRRQPGRADSSSAEQTQAARIRPSRQCSSSPPTCSACRAA